jgi:hypothetical protein
MAETRANALFRQATKTRANALLDVAEARNKTRREGLVNEIRRQSAEAARQANKGARARQASIPKFDPNGLVTIIRGAIKPAAVAPILQTAGPQAVAAVVNRVGANVSGPIAQILAGVISRGNQNSQPIQKALSTLEPKAGPPPIVAVRDPEAIGDVYYAGKRVGYAFEGPTFRLKKTTNKIREWHGWYLEPVSLGKFQFVHKKYPALTSNLTKIIVNSVSPKNVSPQPVSPKLNNLPASTSMNVTSALSTENKTELASAPVAQQAAIRKRLSELFKGLSPGGFTEEQKKQIRAAFRQIFDRKQSPSFLNRILGRTPRAPFNGQPGKSIFEGLFGPAKKVVNKTQNARNNPGNKARLDALQKALNELREALKNSKQAPVINEFIHKYYPISVFRGNKPVPDPANVNRELRKIVGPKNYSKINIETLFKKGGVNNSNLLTRLEEEIKKISGLSSSERHRRLGELLKIVPKNFQGRRKLVTAVIDEIRSIGRNRNPSDARRRFVNMKTNLKLSYTNKEILDALALENKRAANNLSKYIGVGRRRGETSNDYYRRLTNRTRRSYETNSDYERRIRRISRHPNEKRMEIFSRRRGESNQDYSRRITIQNRREEIRRMELNRRRRLRGGLNLPNQNPRLPNQNLPPMEQKAIENVGGTNRAANIVAQVPGGIPAVARAAQSVNEVGPQNAVLIHDNNPLAVEAVKKLGGHKNAIHVLEGLRKTVGPRKAVLDALLKETRKINLAPVVARLVTKTGKIKQTLRNYKKNYNKKLIKSAIFRTRAANIAKRAAKKKV